MGSMISLLDPDFDGWTVDDNGTVGRSFMVFRVLSHHTPSFQSLWWFGVHYKSFEEGTDCLTLSDHEIPHSSVFSFGGCIPRAHLLGTL